MNQNLTVAQIYGTTMGLVTPQLIKVGEFLNLVHNSGWFEQIGLTLLTTTIGFAWPLVLKRFAKKYKIKVS